MKKDLLEVKKKLLYTALISTCAFSALAAKNKDRDNDVVDDYKYALVYERTDQGIKINPVKISYKNIDDLCKVVSEKELYTENINVDDISNGLIIERNVDDMPLTYIYDEKDNKKSNPIIIYHNDNNNNIGFDYNVLRKVR